MTTPEQVWVKRRLEDIIQMVEEAAGDIDCNDYPNFKSWMLDVFDSALNRLHDIDYDNEEKFLDKYSGVISTMTDMFEDQLYSFYKSQTDNDEEIRDGMLSESFDRILDLYTKLKNGETLKPSEQTMINAFRRFVDKGGSAEDFDYKDEEDFDVDDREGERFKWEKWGKPLVYTFSEESEENGEIDYFGEITFNGDEFLGVIATDKRGYLIDYDFYSVFDENIKLQDTLKEMGIEAEIMNFFAEEIIPVLRK